MANVGGEKDRQERLFERHETLRERVNTISEALLAYIHAQHAARTASVYLADSIAAFYSSADAGYEPALALQCMAKSHAGGGYLVQLTEAVSCSVLQPLLKYSRLLEAMGEGGEEFTAAQLKHEHYSGKIAELTAKLYKEAAPKKKGELMTKLRHNNAKLSEATRWFEGVSSRVEQRLVSSWESRFETFDPLLIKLCQALEAEAGHEHLLSSCVNKIVHRHLHAAPLPLVAAQKALCGNSSDGKGVGGATGPGLYIESHLPWVLQVIHQGSMVLIKEKPFGIIQTEYFFKLVGSSLLAFDSPSSAISGEEPNTRFTVSDAKRCWRKFRTGKLKGAAILEVSAAEETLVTLGDGETTEICPLKVQHGAKSLLLLLPDERTLQQWLAALLQARDWDGNARKAALEATVKRSLAHRERVMSQMMRTTTEAAQEALGINVILESNKGSEANSGINISSHKMAKSSHSSHRGVLSSDWGIEGSRISRRSKRLGSFLHSEDDAAKMPLASPRSAVASALPPMIASRSQPASPRASIVEGSTDLIRTEHIDPDMLRRLSSGHPDGIESFQSLGGDEANTSSSSARDSQTFRQGFQSSPGGIGTSPARPRAQSSKHWRTKSQHHSKSTAAHQLEKRFATNGGSISPQQALHQSMPFSPPRGGGTAMLAQSLTPSPRRNPFEKPRVQRSHSLAAGQGNSLAPERYIKWNSPAAPPLPVKGGSSIRRRGSKLLNASLRRGSKDSADSNGRRGSRDSGNSPKSNSRRGSSDSSTSPKSMMKSRKSMMVKVTPYCDESDGSDDDDKNAVSPSLASTVPLGSPCSPYSQPLDTSMPAEPQYAAPTSPIHTPGGSTTNWHHSTSFTYTSLAFVSISLSHRLHETSSLFNSSPPPKAFYPYPAISQLTRRSMSLILPCLC
ncbi:unnamed protein product [Chrysoparadoxa australica]